MKYTKLGNTDIEISRLCMGCMSFGGLTALLSMINSCANGIATVNIDNGYGAGYIANQINKLAVKKEE